MDKDIIIRINNLKTIRHNKDSEYSIPYLRTTQRMMANPKKTNNNTATPTPK